MEDAPKIARPPVRSAAAAAPTVSLFVCANCVRRGFSPTAGARPRPQTPQFGWTLPVHEVVVPCAGRLGPEHLLKAFEHGSDVVCVVACKEDNCHYLEGSLRAQRRITFTSSLLDDIGLGGKRLMIFHLPGSARQDLALGEGASPSDSNQPSDQDLAAGIQAIRDEVVKRLAAVGPNPFRTQSATEESEAYQVDESDDNED